MAQRRARASRSRAAHTLAAAALSRPASCSAARRPAALDRPLRPEARSSSRTARPRQRGLYRLDASGRGWVSYETDSLAETVTADAGLAEAAAVRRTCICSQRPIRSRAERRELVSHVFLRAWRHALPPLHRSAVRSVCPTHATTLRTAATARACARAVPRLMGGAPRGARSRRASMTPRRARQKLPMLTVKAGPLVAVVCKYVRRELRALSRADRETFLDALHTLHHLGADEYQRRADGQRVSPSSPTSGSTCGRRRCTTAARRGTSSSRSSSSQLPVAYPAGRAGAQAIDPSIARAVLGLSLDDQAPGASAKTRSPASGTRREDGENDDADGKICLAHAVARRHDRASSGRRTRSSAGAGRTRRCRASRTGALAASSTALA